MSESEYNEYHRLANLLVERDSEIAQLKEFTKPIVRELELCKGLLKKQREEISKLKQEKEELTLFVESERKRERKNTAQQAINIVNKWLNPEPNHLPKTEQLLNDLEILKSEP